MKHTETPWAHTESGFAQFTTFRGKRTGGRTYITKELDIIAEVQGSSDDEAEFNAEFIVKACNYHDRLMSMLKLVTELNSLDEFYTIQDKIINLLKEIEQEK